MTIVMWGFLKREVDVEILGERVAYTWTCGNSTHDHRIECLWVWHDCTMELDPERAERELDSPMNLSDGVQQVWLPTTLLAHIRFTSRRPYTGRHVAVFTDGFETVGG